jgi:hypothetical protein
MERKLQSDVLVEGEEVEEQQNNKIIIIVRGEDEKRFKAISIYFWLLFYDLSQLRSCIVLQLRRGRA